MHRLERRALQFRRNRQAGRRARLLARGGAEAMVSQGRRIRRRDQGALPREHSFLQVASDNVIVSALKKAEDESTKVMAKVVRLRKQMEKLETIMISGLLTSRRC